jgi:hypothetical protein
MRISQLPKPIILVLLVLVALFASPVSAAARMLPATTTLLSIESAPPLQLGQHPLIRVQLQTADGVPIIGAPIELFLNEARQRRALTNEYGVATFHIRRNLVAGRYALRATYAGSAAFYSASTTSSLAVLPWELHIQTVPALAGVQFALNGNGFASGNDGIARIQIDWVATYQLALLPDQQHQPKQRWQFQRWEADVFVPTRTLQLPSARVFAAGFHVSYLSKPAFIDLAGHAVPPDRIRSYTLKNSLGGLDTFTGDDTTWLQSNRIIRREQGLEEVRILYSVESVIVDGSNIVNQSQQHFYAQGQAEWPIRLSLFKTRFTARDALFGFPIGSGIQLENPNETSRIVPFELPGEVTVHALVRGIYHVNVVGAFGLAPVSPVAQSRDQEVRLLVVSYLDLALLVIVLASIGFGLLFSGRPQLLQSLANPQHIWIMVLHSLHQLPKRLQHAIRMLPRQPSVLPRQERIETPAHIPMIVEHPRREPLVFFAIGLILMGLFSGLVGLDVSNPGLRASASSLARSGSGDGAALVWQVLAIVVLGLVAVRLRIQVRQKHHRPVPLATTTAQIRRLPVRKPHPARNSPAQTVIQPYIPAVWRLGLLIVCCCVLIVGGYGLMRSWQSRNPRRIG